MDKRISTDSSTLYASWWPMMGPWPFDTRLRTSTQTVESVIVYDGPVDGLFLWGRIGRVERRGGGF